MHLTNGYPSSNKKLVQIVQTMVHKPQSFKMYTLFICLLLEKKNLLPKVLYPCFGTLLKVHTTKVLQIPSCFLLSVHSYVHLLFCAFLSFAIISILQPDINGPIFSTRNVIKLVFFNLPRSKESLLIYYDNQIQSSIIGILYASSCTTHTLYTRQNILHAL